MSHINNCNQIKIDVNFMTAFARWLIWFFSIVTHLGESLCIGIRHEYRIVSKSPLFPRFSGSDRAIHDTVEGIFFSVKD